MRLDLKDFQEEYRVVLTTKVRKASTEAKTNDPQAVVLSAATGAGKTVLMTATLEDIIHGPDDGRGVSDTVVLWITDLPELNTQTAGKIVAASSVFDDLTVVLIDSSFDERTFPPGKIYFLNTQKLGKDKLLVTPGDKRTHTIWETIDNTIRDLGGRFIVVIDEAHRGMRRTSAEDKTAQTIVQKFIFGNDVMKPAPIIIGVSATPQRFNDLISGQRDTKAVNIPAEKVRQSGLLKERIVLHYKDDDQRVDLTLLSEATRRLRSLTDMWASYCDDEEIDTIDPVMIVQVEDAPAGTRKDKPQSKTDIAEAIRVITAEFGDLLPPEAYAHTFDAGAPITVGGHTIRYLAPSAIDADPHVKVVFFKMALTTGWDCPRAEVMMSFRSAKDHTLIAQLIGRMIRTPLARRVQTVEALNSVALYLPHYDNEHVEDVIKSLKDETFTPPTDTVKGSEVVEMERVDSLDEVYRLLEKLTTYDIPSARRQKETVRLTKLCRALAADEFDKSAPDREKAALFELLDDQMQIAKSTKAFNETVKGKLEARIGARTFNVVEDAFEPAAKSSIRELTSQNVLHVFDSVADVLGDGLHEDYWQHQTTGTSDTAKIRRARIQVAVLLSDDAIAEAALTHAQQRVDDLLTKHNSKISTLSEKRQTTYDRIRQTGGVPSAKAWTLPTETEWRVPHGAMEYDKHIFAPADGKFKTKLNGLERPIIATEIDKERTVGWFRNEKNKDRSLRIPWEESSGTYRPVYPDFLVIRREGEQLTVDLLDPHSVHLADAVGKATGIALYAKMHGHDFGRIELSSEVGGKVRTLDLKKKAIREQILAGISSQGLEQLYKEHG